MQSVPLNKLVFLSLFILVISPAVFQTNATYHPTTTSKVAKITSTTSNSILTVEKRVNNTNVQVNTSILVELILTNIGSNPIYNINLTEPVIKNPDIITQNLFTPLTFAKFEPYEQRIISYSITSLKVANISLAKTVATYQQVNSPNAPLFTSYSQSFYINVEAKTLSNTEVNLNNLLILSVIAIFYTVILIVRIIFSLGRKSSG